MSAVCPARPTSQGDVLVYVPEESRAHKQVIRKAATNRIIDVDPAIRQVYVVEVESGRAWRAPRRLGASAVGAPRAMGLSDLAIDLPALRRLQPRPASGKLGGDRHLWHEREVIDVRPGYRKASMGWLSILHDGNPVIVRSADRRSPGD